LYKNKSYYNPFYKVSALGMIAALVWLTISIPFVFNSQQLLKEIEKTQSAKASNKNNEENNPFANTTEEKTPASNSFSEEYMHHTDEHLQNNYTTNLSYSHADESLYIAFHGELLSPPPDLYFHLF
jgi:hypothetical protein